MLVRLEVVAFQSHCLDSLQDLTYKLDQCCSYFIINSGDQEWKARYRYWLRTYNFATKNKFSGYKNYQTYQGGRY